MSHNIKQQKCAAGEQANEGAAYAGAPAYAGADGVLAAAGALFGFNHAGASLADMDKVAKTKPSELIEAKAGSQVLNLLKAIDPKNKAWNLNEDKVKVAGTAGHLISVPFIVIEAIGDIAKAAIFNPIQRAIKKRADNNNADDDDVEGGEEDDADLGVDVGDADADNDGDDVDQDWDEDDDCGGYDEEEPKAPKKKGIFAKIFGRRAKKNNSKK